MNSFPYRRLVVIGVTGAGKSTLAQQLAERLRLDYIELDTLNWRPNWTAAPLLEFRGRAQAGISHSNCAARARAPESNPLFVAKRDRKVAFKSVKQAV
jgi:cytidylate kinase